MSQHEIISPQTNYGLFFFAEQYRQQANQHMIDLHPQPTSAFAGAYLLAEGRVELPGPFKTTLTMHDSVLTVTAENGGCHIFEHVRLDRAFLATVGSIARVGTTARTFEDRRLLTELEGLALVEDMCRAMGSRMRGLVQY